jgi:hypothetical protein
MCGKGSVGHHSHGERFIFFLPSLCSPSSPFSSRDSNSSRANECMAQPWPSCKKNPEPIQDNPTTQEGRERKRASVSNKENRIARQRNARQGRHESDRTWSGHIVHLIFSSFVHIIERQVSDETKWLVTTGRAPATIDGEDPPSISSVICLSMDPGPSFILSRFGSVEER